MYEEIEKEATSLAEEFSLAAKLKSGDIVVVGCSTSEVCGEKIGTSSVPEVAEALYRGLANAFSKKGVYIAAQCCEHLNRAVVVERAAVPTADIVNVVPQPKAGGSFATAAYKAMEHPVVVEKIRADAGIDIGQTLVGMHLKEVAVPVRLSVKTLGSAVVTTARTRPKFIGGARAVYDEEMM